MESILRVNRATIRFGGLTAVNNVSIEQKKGEILALIGPNGAGKTTFFNLLTGIYQPNEGSIVFDGKNITQLKSHERSRIGISRTFQNIRLFQSMTVLENLLVAHPECNREGIFSSLFTNKKRKEMRCKIVSECEEILKIVGLSDYIDELSINLPYGKQRLLEIARALSTHPKLLLLDEPGAGMNSSEKDELSEVINHITKKLNTNILLIEHDMRFVMNISSRIIVLDHGEIIANGRPEEIQNNEKVIQAYLGSGNIDIED